MFISKDELALRNGINHTDIWVGYNGLVYDVSSSKLFEGGKHYRHWAGTDLTAEMKDAPHLDHVLNKFPVVGKLAP